MDPDLRPPAGQDSVANSRRNRKDAEGACDAGPDLRPPAGQESVARAYDERAAEYREVAGTWD